MTFLMAKHWTGTSPVSSQRHETGYSSTTQRLCIKQPNGLRGTTIRTSPSSILWLLAQLIQVVVIHLAAGDSHGAAATLLRSLSSQASEHHSSSAKASNQHRVDLSNSHKTRMSEISLVSATSVVAQGKKRQSVNLGRSKPAEVTSLKESSCNLLTGCVQAHIIRETNEGAAHEE